ncbi:MAG TPA: methylmalonyl-CoA mutase family protein [Oligoflexia bacterium]|nr:methylmalonyl-CoA mutase family protein [Oligoflexia bacterium]HMP26588.1 methylmalonyl-CoA mutase family protein [Oligoflexia bacterium]
MPDNKNTQTRKKLFKTFSDFKIKELYTPNDILDSPTKPGEYPYTRGIHPQMYRSKLWTMRQYAGFGSAEETNKRFHDLLKNGGTGISVAFDLPTQMGKDSDHPNARGEVGKVGVAISTTEDMEILLKDLPLDKISISMTINSTAAILLAFLLIVAEKNNIKCSNLRGTIQNDLLKEYIARGTYIYPPTAALRITTDIFKFCSQNMPLWNTISISGYHIREAGSNAVQELAFTFANAITYVGAALKAGLKIDDFAPRLAFFFNCHIDFFEEIAKFRAARKIWAKIMRERFKARKKESEILRFHTQTAGSSLTAQQPLNNITRTTCEALAAILGGTQSLHTNAYDEALGLPTSESAENALRIQQIIAYETGIADYIDPLAGSYVIESLTTEIEQAVFKKIEEIDNIGGMFKAIELEIPQKEIEKEAYQYQKEIEEGSRIQVGVNQFKNQQQLETQIMTIDPAIENAQIKRLAEYKQKRDLHKTNSALDSLCDAASLKKNGNLVDQIILAAKNQATLGEISDVLRSVFGEYD